MREFQCRGSERTDEDTARWTEEEDLRVRESDMTEVMQVCRGWPWMLRGVPSWNFSWSQWRGCKTGAMWSSQETVTGRDERGCSTGAGGGPPVVYSGFCQGRSPWRCPQLEEMLWRTFFPFIPENGRSAVGQWWSKEEEPRRDEQAVRVGALLDSGKGSSMG